MVDLCVCLGVDAKENGSASNIAYAVCNKLSRQVWAQSDAETLVLSSTRSSRPSEDVHRTRDSTSDMPRRIVNWDSARSAVGATADPERRSHVGSIWHALHRPLAFRIRQSLRAGRGRSDRFDAGRLGGGDQSVVVRDEGREVGLDRERARQVDRVQGAQ